MKILYVAHEDMINGASHSLLNLIDELKDKCQFIILTPYKEGAFVDSIKKRNVKIYYAPFHRWVEIKDNTFEQKVNEWKTKNDQLNQLLALKLAEVLKKENIDIIHSNTTVVDIGYRLSKILKIPHIWHAREFGERDFSMYPLCSYKDYYKKISDRNNQIICISKEVMKKFEKKVKANQLHLIYNGVQKEHLNNKKEFNKNKKLICLQSGMILKEKGQDITIKACEKLIKEKKANIELLIAGRGNLNSLGIDIGNKNWIKVLGQVDNLPEIRKNVDIEIVSSKNEAFGRVTIEAMMGQIPVIGSNSGGTKELIKNNENGLLFESGNINDLANKINYFYQNRKEVERMGKNAYMFSKDYFDIKRCAQDIYKLYNKILGD